MTENMIWPAMLFNLCVGLLLAGYLLRAVRRFERRADAIMLEFDQRHADHVAKIDRRYAAEVRKYDIVRDEIKASMRTKVDRMIDEMQAALERTTAELEALANHSPDEPLTDPDTDAPTDPQTQTVPH